MLLYEVNTSYLKYIILQIKDVLKALYYLKVVVSIRPKYHIENKIFYLSKFLYIMNQLSGVLTFMIHLC